MRHGTQVKIEKTLLLLEEDRGKILTMLFHLMKGEWPDPINT